MKRSIELRALVRNARVVACLLVVGGFSLQARGVAEEEPAPTELARESIAEPAPAAPSKGRVTRSAFTSAIVNREPTDSFEQLSNDADSVSYFTELRDLEGETVTHRWEFAGEVAAEISFDVGAPRWRVYSTKSLDPKSLGEWSVSVVDADGNTLTRERLRYVAVGTIEPDAAAAPPAVTAEP